MYLHGKYLVNAEVSTVYAGLTAFITDFMNEVLPQIDPNLLDQAFEEVHLCYRWTHFLPEDIGSLHDKSKDQDWWSRYWNFWNRKAYWRFCELHDTFRIYGKCSEQHGYITLYTTFTEGERRHKGRAGQRVSGKPCLNLEFDNLSETKYSSISMNGSSPFGYFEGIQLWPPDDFGQRLFQYLQQYDCIEYKKSTLALQQLEVVKEWLDLKKRTKETFCEQANISPKTLKAWQKGLKKEGLI